MANINKLVKNKQFMWLGVIAVSAVAIIGGGMYLSDLEVGSDDAAQTQNEAESAVTAKIVTTSTAAVLFFSALMPNAVAVPFGLAFGKNAIERPLNDLETAKPNAYAGKIFQTSSPAAPAYSTKYRHPIIIANAPACGSFKISSRRCFSLQELNASIVSR